jgi:hypothetical protein
MVQKCPTSVSRVHDAHYEQMDKGARSPLTLEAIHYSWRELGRRVEDAGLGTVFEQVNIDVYYGDLKGAQADNASLIVVPCRGDAWQRLLGRGDRSLHWMQPDRLVPNGVRLPFCDPVPVLFWGDGYEDGRKPFVERRDDGKVVFYADIVAATFFMLSRWEETVVAARDEHGRFPAAASVAYRQGFLDRPIVDEYALILRAWLKVLRPRWTPGSSRSSVRLSHDLDMVQSCPSFYAAGRKCVGDLLRRRSLRKAADTLGRFMNPTLDPVSQGISELAALSERYGFRSAFYFMGAKRSAYDSGYDPSSRFATRCVDYLAGRGHEVGFHAGYHTLDDLGRFEWEKSRVEKVLQNNRMGGRQHYLRFRAPDTWRMWENAGLAYDSTLSYADHEGFRCGTCHPFHPFDIEHNRQMNLTEIPLIVMDGTLRQYRGLTPEQGRDRILCLAERCKQVGGVFTLLWHNLSLQGEWEPWVPVYRDILPCLAAI